jgi:heat shock protein HslJ
VSGSAGCNTYTADYSLDGDDLDFEPFAVTKIACSEPIMAQEQRYVSYLRDVIIYYTKIGGWLHLETKDGRALIFTAPE